MLRNMNSVGVKMAENALRLRDTVSATHPYVLSDIVAPLPYKGKRDVC